MPLARNTDGYRTEGLGNALSEALPQLLSGGRRTPAPPERAGSSAGRPLHRSRPPSGPEPSPSERPDGGWTARSPPPLLPLCRPLRRPSGTVVASAVTWPPRPPLRRAACQGIGKRFSIPGASLNVSESCGLVWIALIPTERSACQPLHTCQHKQQQMYLRHVRAP